MNDKARARLLDIFAIAPVIPVITIDHASQALPLARALVAGGLRAIEVTLRTEAGFDAARAMIADVPDAVVGVGTVLTPQDIDRVAELGAAFAVSPGVTPEILAAAAATGIPFAPGIQTA